MPDLVPIDDADAPEVLFYRNLTSESRRVAEMRGELPYFIAEGQLVTEKLIRSNFALHSLLMTHERAALMSDVIRTISAPVYIVDNAMMHAISGFEFHRGVLACGLRRADDDALDAVMRTRIVVALEQVSNPDNVGGIIRSIAGLAGAHASLLLGPGCADPLYRKCIRVSMGHVFRVPWACVDDLPGVVERLSATGVHVLATTPVADATDLRALSFSESSRIAFLMGAEGPGLTPNMMRTASQKVRIPMADGVDSLNVGVATALVLDRIVEALKL